MDIVLTAVTDDLLEAWKRFCSGLPCVRLHSGSILDVDCDAVVSPANSFGFMDGGIDDEYRRHFGDDLQTRVRSVIEERHGGELVVGAADIVETGRPAPAFVIVAPTMRVPMILRDSVNPYLAARAVFRLVIQGVFLNGPSAGVPIRERVRSVAFPGLGTGVGRLSANVCAHQVARAIEDIVLARYTMPRTWAEAADRHQDLYGTARRRLQHEE